MTRPLTNPSNTVEQLLNELILQSNKVVGSFSLHDTALATEAAKLVGELETEILRRVSELESQVARSRTAVDDIFRDLSRC